MFGQTGNRQKYDDYKMFQNKKREKKGDKSMLKIYFKRKYKVGLKGERVIKNRGRSGASWNNGESLEVMINISYKSFRVWFNNHVGPEEYCHICPYNSHLYSV